MEETTEEANREAGGSEMSDGRRRSTRVRGRDKS